REGTRERSSGFGPLRDPQNRPPRRGGGTVDTPGTRAPVHSGRSLHRGRGPEGSRRRKAGTPRGRGGPPAGPRRAAGFLGGSTPRSRGTPRTRGASAQSKGGPAPPPREPPGAE